MARQVDPDASVAAVFARRVTRLRQIRGWSQVELARRVRVHPTRINQIERVTGHKPTLDLARDLDRELEADELLIDLWPHVYREAFPDWSRAFMEQSARAVRIRAYAAHTVPGLLQVQDYARSVLGAGRTLKTSEQLKERVAARMARQERLTADDRPELVVVLDEAVLLRPIGGPTVMRRQLRRLLETESDPNIMVQVLPFSVGAHPAMGGSLTILTLPDGSESAYTEGADYGQLIEDPAEVRSYSMSYDQLRGHALPSAMSLNMIRTMMEDAYLDSRLPTRHQRRRLAQVQLQQPGGRRLRRGGNPLPRPRPRA
ncbi:MULTISPECIES: helix-turn-helix domain-containing protein [unclassified Streptomyces]|uniref:helix-turn-helix domain-containing protein n=1 Tax=unclassified Streptomyces TaxID=2593676 RepID=UPI002E2D9032|nr:helix-turn-helix transcriptional regulator [Streptomyces sp. NBC_00223]